MHPPRNQTGPEQVSPPPFTQPPNRPNGKRTAAFVLFGLAALSLVCALICWAIVAYLDVQFGLDGPGTGWFIMLALPIYLLVFILSRVLPVATAAFALIGAILFFLARRDERNAAAADPLSGPIIGGEQRSAPQGGNGFDDANGPISR